MSTFLFHRDKHISMGCSWENRLDFLCSHEMYVKDVPGDGFCFLNALQVSLKAHCGLQYSIPDLCNLLMDYIAENCIELSNFHFSEEKMLEECLEFFLSRDYNQDCVDIIVSAAAEALKISISIYYNNNGALYLHDISCAGSLKKAVLIFSESVSHPMLNHYDAVLPFHLNLVPDPCSAMQLFPVLKEWMEKAQKDMRKIAAVEKENLDMVTVEEQVKNSVVSLPVASQYTDGIADSQTSRDSDCHLVEEDSTFPSPDVSVISYEPATQDDESARSERSEADESFISATSAGSEGLYLDHSATVIPERHRAAAIIAKTLWRKHKDKCQPEIVSVLPGEIDDDCCYIIPNCENTWQPDTNDLRHFVMHTSNRQGLEGKRKTGKCEGAFQCQNEQCPFLKSSGGVANHLQFNNVGGLKECKMCSRVVSKVECGRAGEKPPYKIVEYHKGLETAIVWHYGLHTCPLKDDAKAQRKGILKKLSEIGKRPGMSVKEFALGEVGKKLLEKDIPGMIKEADLYVDPTIMNRLAVEEEESYHHTQHSFDAVADLKRDAGKFTRIGAFSGPKRRRKLSSIRNVTFVFADMYDPYIIWKAGNGQLTNGRDFAMKSSRINVRMMVEMDEDGPDNVLKGQAAFFDTTYNKIDGFKTIGMWVYHPGKTTH